MKEIFALIDEIKEEIYYYKNSLEGRGIFGELKEYSSKSFKTIIKKFQILIAICPFEHNCLLDKKFYVQSLEKYLEECEDLKEPIYIDKIEMMLDEIKNNFNEKEKGNMSMKKIFISHSTQDREYVEAFIELMEYLGIRREQLFCSSVSGYGIPLGNDIYEYLRKELENTELIVLYFLSDQYYNSPACLNEMGAVWMIKANYYTIILPGFTFEKIEGAINPSKVGIDFNQDVIEPLNELKNIIEALFGLKHIEGVRWEKYRNQCVKKIQEIYRRKIKYIV